MKQRRFSSRSRYAGFTLVELLVVIVIIGLLAAAAFPVITGMINQARRVKSTALAQELKTAISSYYAEYQVYPNTSGGAAGVDTFYDGKIVSKPAQDLVYGLCGNINPYSPAVVYAPTVAINTRNIVYMSPNKTDVAANGLIKTPFTNTAAPYYNYAMDTDYSGVLNDAGVMNLPDFSLTGAAFQASIASSALKITNPIAVWTCNDEAPTTSTAPNRWSRTY